MKKSFKSLLIILLLFTSFALFACDNGDNDVEDKSATSIEVTGAEEAYVGDKVQLNVVLKPVDADDEVIWSSEDDEVATVDQNGLVTCLKEGYINIMSKAKYVSCAHNIRIKALPTLTITNTTTCEIGQEIALTATTDSEDTITWSSSDTTVATIVNGYICGIKEGTTTLTAKVGPKTVDVEFTVTKVADKLEIVGSNTVMLGETITYTANTNITGTVTWESDNTDIATIDSTGKVTTKSAGTVTIICKCGSLSKNLYLTVELPDDKIFINGDDEVEVESEIRLVALTGKEGTIEWSSSDSTVALVDVTGLVTGLKAGTAVITAKVGDLTETKTITVNAKKVFVAFIGEDGYESITDALIMAEAGATINVIKGTYTEDLEIFQSVKLLGPNADVNPNTGNREEEAIITGTLTIKAGVSDVEVSGFEFKEGCLIEAISTTEEIKGIKLSNNYFHDINEVEYTWSAGRNYDIPCFIKMGCANNILSDVTIENNKFENIPNVNLFVAIVTNFTLSGNTFTNFKSDAVRIDGGYNYGLFDIKNNTFKNDTLGGTNGIYFRSTGSNATAYEQANMQVIKIKKNVFENIGTVGVDFNGAMSINGYQEYGLTIDCTYNEFKNCPNFILFRNNATEANHTAYVWKCNVNYNVFEGETTGYYFSNKNATDTELTNPALANLENNLFVNNNGEVITDKNAIETYLFGVKDFASYLESYDDLNEGIKPTYIVDLNVLNSQTDDIVTYFEEDYIVGTTAFSSIEEALDVCANGDIIYLAADTYSLDLVITKSITILGNNYNINPNDSTRNSETIFDKSITVEANDVTINGITLTNDAKIIGSQSGLKNLTISYVIFDEVYTLNTGAVGQVELLTTDSTKFFEDISIMYSLFSKSSTDKRVTKIIGTNVKNFTFIGNVCYGTSNGIYDDCIKLFTPTNQTTIGVQGNVLVQDNSFYNIGQYTVWCNSYTTGKFEIYNNYFENVGLTDGVGSTYIRGAVTFTNPTVGEGNVEILIIGNEIAGSSTGVRLENAGFTADNWSAKVNNNIFEEIVQVSKIITNEGKNTLSLIDAKSNYFDISVSADNFIGVSDFTGTYANRDDVPKYVDPSKILPTAIDVSNEKDYILVEDTYQIELEFTPSDTSYKNVIYTSSDETIATVSRNGLVTGVKSGTVTITIQSKADGDVKKEIELVILEFKPETEIDEVLNGSVTEINMSITPETVENQVVSYTSSNEAVATVDVDGKITALAAGTTKITVTSNYYTGLTYEFDVNVLTETKVNVESDIDAVLALMNEANVSTVIHNNNAKVIGYQEPGYWMCDLYGSVSKFYFGSKAINSSIQTEINETNRPGTKKTSTEYITVHDTASIAASAGAASHASYVRNGGGGTSWSFTVGADGIYYQVPTDEITFHAGDGSRVFAVEDSGIVATGSAFDAVITIDSNGYYAINGTSTTLRPYKIIDNVESIDMTNYTTADINDLGIYCEVGTNGNYYLGKTWYSNTYKKIGNYGGNRNSIGIETCVNQTADLYKTWQLTASLVARLLIENDLTIDRVVQHHYFSGKDCPGTMRYNGLWDNFISMVEAEYEIAKDYSEYTITMVSNNPDLVDNTGRVIGKVTENTTVTYTVTVSRAGVSKSQVFTSVIPA